MNYPRINLNLQKLAKSNQKHYKFTSVLPRVVKDIVFQGTEGPDERSCLQKLSSTTGKAFRLNQALFYSDYFASTPDAVYYSAGTLVAIAEFKSTTLGLKQGLTRLKGQALVQASVAMLATQAREGYVVIFSSSEQEHAIVHLRKQDIDLKKVSDRTTAYRRYVADMKGLMDSPELQELAQFLKRVGGHA